MCPLFAIVLGAAKIGERRQTMAIANMEGGDMKTWLDGHVHGASKNFGEIARQFPEQASSMDSQILRQATADDAFAFKLLIEASHEMMMRERAGDPARGLTNALLETAAWVESLAPFFLEVEREPLAASFDRETVNELAGTYPSPDVRLYALDGLSRHGTIYLDIADRALMFGDGLQLCALFITEAKAGIRFWGVFGEPGRKGNRRVAWIEGRGHILTDQHHDQSVRTLDGCLRAPGVPRRPLADIARDAGVDLMDVLKDLESFAFLATTYVLTEMEYAQGQAWAPLPHLPAGHQRRLGRRGAAVAKTHSLFRVWRVTARRLDRGEREHGHVGGTWRLGHRITVSGHYRLQACGAGRTQRRLRWIAPHGRGPLDGLPPRYIVRAGARNGRRGPDRARGHRRR
jgi:hypothetical protein